MKSQSNFDTHHSGGSPEPQELFSKKLTPSVEGANNDLPFDHLLFPACVLSSNLPWQERCLIAIIYQRYEGKSWCHDNNWRLAKYLGTTQNAARVALSKLVKSGWVISEKAEDGERVLRIVPGIFPDSIGEVRDDV